MTEFSPYSPFASAAAQAPRFQWPSFRPQSATAPPAAATYRQDGFQAAMAPAGYSASSMGISGWFQSMMARIKSWFRSPFSSEPGPALATVPMKPEYRQAQIDRSNPKAAVLGTANYVFQNYPQYFNSGEHRPVAYEMMTTTIGILRANGFDAHRVVNHASYAVGDPNRYGKDALVLNGTIYDTYFSWGSPASRPQALDVGPYGNRPRE